MSAPDAWQSTLNKLQLALTFAENRKNKKIIFKILRYKGELFEKRLY